MTVTVCTLRSVPFWLLHRIFVRGCCLPGFAVDYVLVDFGCCLWFYRKRLCCVTLCVSITYHRLLHAFTTHWPRCRRTPYHAARTRFAPAAPLPFRRTPALCKRHFCSFLSRSMRCCVHYYTPTDLRRFLERFGRYTSSRASNAMRLLLSTSLAATALVPMDRSSKLPLPHLPSSV